MRTIELRRRKAMKCGHKILVFMFTFIFVAVPNLVHPDECDFVPALKNGKKKFKISVIQSGEYWQYASNFMHQLNALKNLGWMEFEEIPPDAAKTVPGIFGALAKKEYSKYIEFVPELYFDFEFKEKEKASDPKFLEILANKDVDLIISLGTRTGKVLSKIPSLSTPVIAVQISDPVKAGVIQSCDDSGNDWLTATCDPDKYLRQIKIFHDVIEFKRLGLIYEDTEVGRSIAALDYIEDQARKKGFEIFAEFVDDNKPDSPARYLEAVKKIAPKIDAMYFTIHSKGLDIGHLSDVMAVLNKYKVPPSRWRVPNLSNMGC